MLVRTYEHSVLQVSFSSDPERGSRSSSAALPASVSATHPGAGKPPLPHHANASRGASPQIGSSGSARQHDEESGSGVEQLMEWHKEVSGREARLEEREAALQAAVKRFQVEVSHVAHSAH